jgi:hypothetical protein
MARIDTLCGLMPTPVGGAAQSALVSGATTPTVLLMGMVRGSLSGFLADLAGNLVILAGI